MSERKINGEILEDKFKDYAKKPVVVQAYQTDVELEIETLEGTMKANKGDYIIKGIEGELYPCKSDIFAKTYEEPSETLDLDSDFEEWDKIINRLDKTNRRLVKIEEIYQTKSDEILSEARETEVDFKAIYGANNKDTRKQYVDEQLTELLEEKKELEFTKADDNRRISYLKRLIDMKIELIKYN